MTAPTKRPDATFPAMLSALAALYQAELERLVEELRPRILAGDFSGSTAPPNDEPRHMHLEAELRASHPWVRTSHGARAVLACSSWPDHRDCSRYELDGWHDRDLAAESMAHDVLAVASRRGWIKPYRLRYDAHRYALRVA
jgi:hypothetical protein